MAHHSDHVHDKALYDWCDAGILWDPVLSAYFYHMDPTTFRLTRLSPPGSTSRPATNYTSFFYFTGIWGDAEYPENHPNQRKVPYFGLKRYVSGPQGPIWKGLVRKGLFPDDPEPKKLIQYVVGAFMTFYPCCLKGWRVWIFLAVLIGVIVFMVLGIKQGVTRYRTRRMGYKRIDTEIPLSNIS